MDKIEKYLVKIDDDVMTVLERQETYKLKTVLVVDTKRRVLGTISDGDFRRYLLKHGQPPKSLTDILRKDFFHVFDSENIEKRIVAFDLSKGVVPIINREMILVDIYDGTPNAVEPLQNVLKAFTSIAPVRISFAGGGSDVANWFKDHSGLCINAAIDTYARVNFKLRDDEYYNIQSFNTDQDLILTKRDLFFGGDNDLVLNCLRKFPNLPNVDVTVYCDFNPGSGLGGSSSLCVALIQGCAKLTGVHLTKNELQSLAYEVERFDTGILGGWQDQIASVLGGLVLSTFDRNGIKSTKIHLTTEEQEALNSCLFLFKVGVSRSSSQVHKAIDLERDTKTFTQNMSEVLSVAREVEDIIRERDFGKLGFYLDKGWQAKRKLSNAISNPKIDNLYDLLMSFGANGGRLLGAGGSGYLMMFVDLPQQGDFLKKCSNAGMDFERFKLDMLGARIIGETK